MIIQFTVIELMVFLVCAVAILAGVLTLPILFKIKKIVSIAKNVMEDNKESLAGWIGSASSILSDMEHVGGNLKNATDKLSTSLPAIIQEVEQVTGTVSGIAGQANKLLGFVGPPSTEVLQGEKSESSGYVRLFEELLHLINNIWFSGSK